MSNFGWIKLPREIVEHSFWRARAAFDTRSAFVDLMLLASFETHDMIFEMQPLLVQAGELITSLENLSARWRWSTGKVRRFLSALQKIGEIDYQSTNLMTRIRLCKWSEYQGVKGGVDTPAKNAYDNRAKSQRIHSIKIRKKRMKRKRRSIWNL